MERPWTDIYRPRHLADITGQDILKAFLQRLVATGITRAPHLILHGPPGTGKTSIAMAFASDLYPTVPGPIATMYLNASDERSKTTVRERICEFLRTSWVGVSRKIIILDEVETMTTDAQLTLRSLLDAPLIAGTPPPLFLFLCNTLSRIVPLIRSRALALFCGHLSADQIRGLLFDIQRLEGREADPLPTPLACLLSRGDMRSFLQRAQAGEDPNVWLPWLQRLLNVAPARAEIVWADGLERVPAWILVRHVLVFAIALGIPTAVGADVWDSWLRVALTATSASALGAAWCSVLIRLNTVTT